MAKWYGKVGYANSAETGTSGVWTNTIVERYYYGDYIRNVSSRLQSSSDVNDNIVLSSTISIVADQFALDNYHAIRYVEFMNSKWKVSNVEVQHPRLILVMGELYNG